MMAELWRVSALRRWMALRNFKRRQTGMNKTLSSLPPHFKGGCKIIGTSSEVA
jgi:hypothetical protein